MENVDIKIMPSGKFEFFVNMTYPSWHEGPTGAIVTGQWSLTGVQPWPRKTPPLPVMGGDYRFDRSTSLILFTSESGNAIVSLDIFVVPPVPTTTGPGTLLHDADRGTPVSWMVT